MSSSIKEAVEILKDAERIVAITGAGISVPSGIPDFRSAGSGVWENHDPTKVASISEFYKNPDAFYDWLEPLVESMRDAEPNAAHLALTELQKMGKLTAVVTQNIDGLHEKAGSDNVFAVHGHCNTMTCIVCGSKVETSREIWDAVLEDGTPFCEKCEETFGELIPMKPDVVLFGENLPMDVVSDALEHIERSDVVIVIGSSLAVHPVAAWPDYAMSLGKRVVLFNIGKTHIDHLCTVVQGDASKTLPEVLKEVKQ